MNKRLPTRVVRRGRIFPEIQWTEEQLTQWKARQDEFYQRCKPIFDSYFPSNLAFSLSMKIKWFITPPLNFGILVVT